MKLLGLLLGFFLSTIINAEPPAPRALVKVEVNQLLSEVTPSGCLVYLTILEVVPLTRQPFSEPKSFRITSQETCKRYKRELDIPSLSKSATFVRDYGRILGDNEFERDESFEGSFELLQGLKLEEKLENDRIILAKITKFTSNKMFPISSYTISYEHTNCWARSERIEASSIEGKNIVTAVLLKRISKECDPEIIQDKISFTVSAMDVSFSKNVQVFTHDGSLIKSSFELK